MFLPNYGFIQMIVHLSPEAVHMFFFHLHAFCEVLCMGSAGNWA
jgi:hypothetical protein